MWNVLIADDEPKIRQGLKNTLEPFDLPYVCAQEAKTDWRRWKSKGI